MLKKLRKMKAGREAMADSLEEEEPFFDEEGSWELAEGGRSREGLWEIGKIEDMFWVESI
jgi:hypothetical protein